MGKISLHSLQCKSSSCRHSNAHIKLKVVLIEYTYVGKVPIQIRMKRSYKANKCILN